jgi:perosamine synthetase
MFVPVSRPLMGAIEDEYVLNAVHSKEISGLSKQYIPKFESEFAAFCNVKHAASVNSGTTAIQLAVAVLGIGPGDEVLVSSLTNMATFFAVLYQGAKPIPIDSEFDTLNMDPKLLEAKITSKTKAIIVVHLYGHSADMDPIMKIAREHNLYVIEDAAEAHGAKYNGQMIGSIGDIGCFSFYSNKIITTGEGGMLVTNNDEWAKRAQLIKNLAFGDENKFMHKAFGYKFQMTNLQAALGAAQMTRINDIIARKREIAAYYTKAFAVDSDIITPIEKPYAFNVYWMYNVVLDGKLSGKRGLIIDELKKLGVESREDFIPFNQQKIFIEQGIADPESCPVANRLGADGMYLPSGNDISPEELAYAAQSFLDVVKKVKEMSV